MDRRIVAAPFATLATALVLPAAAFGGSASIAVEADGANKFAPKVANFSLISSNFYWYWGTGGVTSRPHNVRQDDRLFRSGAPTRNGGNISFSVSAGTFPYFCEVHGGPGGRGMSGKVKVPPKEGPPEPDGVPVEWAVDASTTGDRYDVRFRVNDGRWRTWKQGTKKHGDIFGRDDDPVNFSGLKVYEIQARSKLKSDPSRRSGWSPPLVIP